MIKNIKTEKIRDYISEHQIELYLYDEDIEKIRDKVRAINRIGLLSIYTILVFCIIVIPLNIPLILLSCVPIILSFVLYNEVIKERVIKPKYKDLYENGYHIFGNIEIDGNTIKVCEYLYDKNDLDELIEKIIKEYQEYQETKK